MEPKIKKPKMLVRYSIIQCNLASSITQMMHIIFAFQLMTGDLLEKETIDSTPFNVKFDSIQFRTDLANQSESIFPMITFNSY